MTNEEKIRVLLAHKNISQSELARRLCTTPSNLNQKIKRNTLTNENMETIASVLDCKWVAYFELEDGRRI